MGDKLTDTDTNPEPVKGVGESTTRRGEDVIKEEGAEPGRHPNQGTKGADRPYGTAESSSASSVAGQDNIDESMPNMPPGDQGG
jgi:hypothetical protein